MPENDDYDPDDDGGDGNDSTPQGGNDTSGTSGSAGGEGDERRYTREELEKTVERRLKREREKYRDYDQLKQQAQERQQANQTLEQQVEQLRREQADRDAAAVQEKADLAAERLHSKLVRGGLSDSDAGTLVESIDSLRLLEDGKPSKTAIDKIAKALVKVGTRAAADQDQGQKGGSAVPTMNELIRSAANRSRM